MCYIWDGYFSTKSQLAKLTTQCFLLSICPNMSRSFQQLVYNWVGKVLHQQPETRKKRKITNTAIIQLHVATISCYEQKNLKLVEVPDFFHVHLSVTCCRLAQTRFKQNGCWILKTKKNKFNYKQHSGCKSGITKIINAKKYMITIPDKKATRKVCKKQTAACIMKCCLTH